MKADSIAVAAILVLFLQAAFQLAGCADHRPGDFAPDQIRWIDRNVK